MNLLPVLLSLKETRAIMLAAQGLLAPVKNIATKASVLEIIQQMSALQIDTIQVVARSPYLVLWSRLGDYPPAWLDELLAEGKLFEYWSHEACFLPIEDYHLYRHQMISPNSLGWKYSHEWLKNNVDQVEKVRQLIREQGAVRSIDFTRNDGKSGGWWEWKPEKRALEMLFTAGELMIVRRHKFQRIYDLRERVLPTWDDSQLLSPEQTHRALVLKAIAALGITTASWVADYFRMNKKVGEALTKKLCEEGKLLAVRVEGWQEPAYVLADNRRLIEDATAGKLPPKRTTLLSPFDPLVWDRTRARTLFDFDYRLECYTPANKRRYGYFTLPILHHDALVGRLDAKAHRREGCWEVKAIYLEPKVVITDELVTELASALRDCAKWHQTPTVVINQSEPKELAALLKSALN